MQYMTKNAIDEIQEISENPKVSVETLETIPDGETKKIKEIKKVDPMSKKIRQKFIIFCVVAILGGAATGFGASKLKGKTNNVEQLTQVAEDVSQIKAGDVFGVQDKDTFDNSAQGYLEKGGIEGEGSHKLLREGGITQTVALTSAVTDLDQFEGMEVKISGETHKAQKSGWFMDVGRVEVINVDAEAPIQSLD